MADDTSELFASRQKLTAKALLVGDRFRTKPLATVDRLAVNPLVISTGHGCAALFRFGAIVLFGLEPAEEASFLADMAKFVSDPLDEPITEELDIRQGAEKVDVISHGDLMVHSLDLERIQVISIALSETVMLDRYEQVLGRTYHQIQPLAHSLENSGQIPKASHELLRQIGTSLRIEHEMVNRVEVSEKPEIVWESSELDHLYVRLSQEFELKQRRTMLERKLELNSRTVQTVIELLRHETSLRVEWYIVVLIVIEILLTLYELFIKH